MVREVVGWNRIRQGQVRFEKGANRSNVFPVSLEDIGKDLVLLQRGWDDVPSEVVVAIVQRVD